MTKIVIDTSAWIDFFHNKAGRIGDTVAALIEQDLAIITGPVLTELMQGLKTPQEAKTLNELLSIIPFAEVTRSDWEKTGDLLRNLRRKGITVPLTDTLIAIVAKRHGYGVLTLDRHFEHLEVPLHPARN